MTAKEAINQYLLDVYEMELRPGTELDMPEDLLDSLFWFDVIDDIPFSIFLSEHSIDFYWGEDQLQEIDISGYNSHTETDEFLDFLLAIKEVVSNFYLSKEERGQDMANLQ